jgi:hypothetical protein
MRELRAENAELRATLAAILARLNAVDPALARTPP